MTVTVAIAAYNAAATIQATLDSVLNQTVPPDEILVVNDGSTDSTSSILDLYRPRITVFEQENKGLSAARNVLCRISKGDLIAFLDSDDVWHPRYLEVQGRLFKDYPTAVALFTGHTTFRGQGGYQWQDDALDAGSTVELIAPHTFLERYSKATGPFASPSYCCVPKRALDELGREPFDASVRVCDDAYLFYLLALSGPVVYASVPLAAYRLTAGSLSSDRARNLRYGVYVFELLEARYKYSRDKSLYKAFTSAFSSKRREYAKLLMGGGKVSEARSQIWHCLRSAGSPEAFAKSFGLLFLSFMPSQLQPTWPSGQRQIDGA